MRIVIKMRFVTVRHASAMLVILALDICVQLVTLALGPQPLEPQTPPSVCRVQREPGRPLLLLLLLTYV